MKRKQKKLNCAFTPSSLTFIFWLFANVFYLSTAQQAGFAMPKTTNMYQSALSNFATICHLW